MEIKTLYKVSDEVILQAFNKSFSDYSIPLQLTIEQLRTKILTEEIDKRVSVGTFEDGELIGLILHAKRDIDGKVICYNGGTGVIPEKRGQSITCKMYDYIIPKMKASKVHGVVLEVISDNIPAIKTYQKVGFKRQRKLDCYKGEISALDCNPNIKIVELSNLNHDLVASLCTIKPTWQNSNETITRLDDLLVFVAYEGKKEVGYLAFKKSNNRILQLGVAQDMRRQKIGSALLNHVNENHTKATTVTNVDSRSAEAAHFFRECGLTNFLQQDEMYLDLT